MPVLKLLVTSAMIFILLHPHLTGNEHQQIIVVFDSVKTHNVNVDLSLCETTDQASL